MKESMTVWTQRSRILNRIRSAICQPPKMVNLKEWNAVMGLERRSF
jgi:hypothetical protein